MSSSPRVIALVMAAGQARRFGTDKRRARLPCGKMLLKATLDEVSEAFDKIYLATPLYDDRKTFDINDKKIEILVSTRSKKGLGYSIADAATQLIHMDEAADALVIILADMPKVSISTYKSLIRASDTEHIVRPTFCGKPGNPVSFGRDFWQELSSLKNPEGARSLLRKHAKDTQLHNVNDPGILFDIDFPADIHLWTKEQIQ